MERQSEINSLRELCTIRGNRIDELQNRVWALEADAARWHTIAPHLRVDWDEDGSGRRCTWVSIPEGSVVVPNAGHSAWADGADFDDVGAAIDAAIKLKEISQNG